MYSKRRSRDTAMRSERYEETGSHTKDSFRTQKDIDGISNQLYLSINNIDREDNHLHKRPRSDVPGYLGTRRIIIKR